MRITIRLDEDLKEMLDDLLIENTDCDNQTELIKKLIKIGAGVVEKEKNFSKETLLKIYSLLITIAKKVEIDKKDIQLAVDRAKKLSEKH